MEHFLELQEKAQDEIRIAEHLLVVTYALVKDPKMLLGVAEKILSSMDAAFSSLVYYERRFKRVPPFHTDLDTVYALFKQRLVGRYNISKDYIKLVDKLRDILEKHKNSPVEFARTGKFVICSDIYELETLSYKQVHGYLQAAKRFTKEITKITDKHKNIFKIREHFKKRFF